MGPGEREQGRQCRGAHDHGDAEWYDPERSTGLAEWQFGMEEIVDGEHEQRHADVTVHTREAEVTWWGPPGFAPLSRLRPRPLAATFLPGRGAAAIRRTRAGCLGRGGSVRTAPTDGPPFPAGRGP